jgi:cysteine desulfurase / selenocysteine lyase
MNPEAIKKDFPMLERHKDLIYLDSACTSQKPKFVLDRMMEYYEDYCACAGRSSHTFSRKTGERIAECREKIAEFVGAKSEGIVYTRNCTEALNMVARSFDFSSRKKVVTTILEHHSALLPFEIRMLRGEIKLDFVKPLPDGTFDAGMFAEKIGRDTALVVVHHTNNTLGTSVPLKEVCKIAHEQGARVLVDGAQGVPHSKFSFAKAGCDYLAFSGHKMLGPTGIGALVSTPEILESMPLLNVGGDTIEQVKTDSVVWAKPPRRMEAGIQHYEGIIGLSAAAEYLSRIGMDSVEKTVKATAWEAREAISQIKNVKLYGPSDKAKAGSMVTFNLRGMPPHQVALMLDKMKGIAVRSGVFCAQPGMEHLGACDGAVRASFYVYNSKKDAEILATTLKDIASLAP